MDLISHLIYKNIALVPQAAFYVQFTPLPELEIALGRQPQSFS